MGMEKYVVLRLTGGEDAQDKIVYIADTKEEAITMIANNEFNDLYLKDTKYDKVETEKNILNNTMVYCTRTYSIYNNEVIPTSGVHFRDYHVLCNKNDHKCTKYNMIVMNFDYNTIKTRVILKLFAPLDVSEEKIKSIMDRIVKNANIDYESGRSIIDGDIDLDIWYE